MTARTPLLLALVACAAPGLSRAQTMLDQEQRLIDIHALLLDLPPLQAPAALEGGTLDASLEAVTIPHIDGTTGARRQLTASDHTPVFPRPRVTLGLPAGDLRAFVGLAAIPPLELRQVSTAYVAGEAGLGLASGALRVGARLHAVYASSRAPVTDPTTRDVLETAGGGADLAVGLHLRPGGLALEPYAGLGAVTLHGRFRVTSDGNVLHSTTTGALVVAGLRTVVLGRWELVGELDAYPGRLVHTDVRVGYLFGP